MAFGSILEGPDPTKLKPLVEQAMPMLIELMKDNSVVVKVNRFTFTPGVNIEAPPAPKSAVFLGGGGGYRGSRKTGKLGRKGCV